MLDRFLWLQPVWLPTALFIPLLYALGWIGALPLTLIGLPTDQVSITGTVLSFVRFIALMPRWVAVRWTAEQPWAALGICRANPQKQPAPAAALLKGLLVAAGLLTVITSVVLIEGSGEWRGEVDTTRLANAVLLCLGVGFAEELICRGWLWTELNRMMGSHRGALPCSSQPLQPRSHTLQPGARCHEWPTHRPVSAGDGSCQTATSRQWFTLGLYWSARRACRWMVSASKRLTSAIAKCPVVVGRPRSQFSEPAGWRHSHNVSNSPVKRGLD